MPASVRLFPVALLVAVLVGCGDKGPPDSQFEMRPADVVLADVVRGALEDMEPGADPKQVGGLLLENLEGVLEEPGAEGHEETYQKIMEAAQKLAQGDASQIQELRTLAETLPK